MAVVVTALAAGCGGSSPPHATTTPAVSAVPAGPTSTPTADPTSSWTAVTNIDGHFSLRYPSSLNVTYNCAAEVWLDQLSAPAQATCPVGESGEVLFFFQSVAGDQRNHLGSNDGSFPNDGTAPLGAGTPVVVDGVTAMRYSGTFLGGGMGVVAGEKQCVYVAYARGRSYAAIYSQNADTPDMSADFKLMVEHTLNFSG